MNAAPDPDLPRNGDSLPGNGHGLPDDELTAKDRSYSPSSGRETEVEQQEPTDAGLKPGTGGPDDVGDIPVPDDDIDPATIVERSEPAPGSEHRAGDA